MPSDNINLCDTCPNKVDLVIETWDSGWGSYSYKRNGICYNRESYCKITGQKLWGQKVVKCTHAEGKKK